jgi:hypothetical protein
MKSFSGRLLHSLGRIVIRQQVQQRTANVFDRGRVRLDLHPFHQERIAGGGVTIPTLDRDTAEAARAAWLQAVIVAEGGNFDAELAAGREDRRSVRKAVGLPVNDHRRHSSNSFP